MHIINFIVNYQTNLFFALKYNLKKNIIKIADNKKNLFQSSIYQNNHISMVDSTHSLYIQLHNSLLFNRQISHIVHIKSDKLSSKNFIVSTIIIIITIFIAFINQHHIIIFITFIRISYYLIDNHFFLH